jgi:hypothetical protein
MALQSERILIRAAGLAPGSYILSSDPHVVTMCGVCQTVVHHAVDHPDIAKLLPAPMACTAPITACMPLPQTRLIV